jgi:hypothetical protein
MEKNMKARVLVQTARTPKGLEVTMDPSENNPQKERPSYYAKGVCSWGLGKTIAEALRLASAEGKPGIKLPPGAVVWNVFEVWEDTKFVDARGNPALHPPADSPNDVRLVLSLDAHGNIVELLNN